MISLKITKSTQTVEILSQIVDSVDQLGKKSHFNNIESSPMNNGYFLGPS